MRQEQFREWRTMYPALQLRSINPTASVTARIINYSSKMPPSKSAVLPISVQRGFSFPENVMARLILARER